MMISDLCYFCLFCLYGMLLLCQGDKVSDILESETISFNEGNRLFQGFKCHEFVEGIRVYLETWNYEL